MIVVELAWLGTLHSSCYVRYWWRRLTTRTSSTAGFLGVLFLASGGAAADTAANYFNDCSFWSPALARTVCNETSAGAAFGFLGWLARESATTTPQDQHSNLMSRTSVGVRRRAPCAPHHPG